MWNMLKSIVVTVGILLFLALGAVVIPTFAGVTLFVGIIIAVCLLVYILFAFVYESYEQEKNK